MNLYAIIMGKKKPFPHRHSGWAATLLIDTFLAWFFFRENL